MDGGKGALEVDLNDRVPVGFAHREHHAISQDAGVVDEDVQSAEGVDGLVDHVPGGVEVADISAVHHCLAAHGPDLLDHLARWSGIAAPAVGGGA